MISMETFLLCFVPLFVAVDAIGMLPIYLHLTRDLKRAQLRRIIRQSLLTAAVVALGFLVLGQALFRFLNITSADFMVAGGTLLFIISLSDLFVGRKIQRQVEPDEIGPVPLWVPLIVGPAVLTTIILLADRYGRGLTAVSTVANILIAGLAFWSAQWMNRVLGKAGMRAVSKIASLILAAIGVRMVREGLLFFLGR